MSDEGRRDMKTMLDLLEADGKFDHTEGLFSRFTDADPEGFWGTDFLGYAKIIKELKAELTDEKKKLAEETTSKEMLQ